MDDVVTGLFGKLPAHGDFIHRILPSDFISVWDEWLQHYIAGSQEQIGEDWLDIYLTSPIWRFMFSEGTVDDSAWSGIMLPSVDRIGRYFPFSIITKIPSELNSLEFLLSQNSWLDSVEELALQALNGDLTVDELMQLIDEIDIIHNTIYTNVEPVTDEKPVLITMDFEEQLPTSVSDYILDAVLLKSVSSYSAWTTSGSERVAPCLFFSQGLPPISGASAMMNGVWPSENWQLPYRLNVV